jgi:apolipoprotein D and lipocalin family protein
MNYKSFFAALFLVQYCFAWGDLRGACQVPGNITMVNVDLDLYSGTWYEVAHSKSNFFTKDCQCSTAEYSKVSSELLRMVKTCRLYRPEGRINQAVASARLTEPGHFGVNYLTRFIEFADTDYRVIYIDESYEYAIVVSCSKLSGSLIWIYSRTPEISDEKWNGLADIAASKGFDTSDLTHTIQDSCWSFENKEQANIRSVNEQYSKFAICKKCQCS